MGRAPEKEGLLALGSVGREDLTDLLAVEIVDICQPTTQTATHARVRCATRTGSACSARANEIAINLCRAVRPSALSAQGCFPESLGAPRPRGLSAVEDPFATMTRACGVPPTSLQSCRAIMRRRLPMHRSGKRTYRFVVVHIQGDRRHVLRRRVSLAYDLRLTIVL